MKKITMTAMATIMALGMTVAAQADIVIGATVSATGPASYLGDPEAKTLEMLTEKLNAEGGINGEKIKLVLYDDNGDPNKARTFATRLVEDDEVVGRAAVLQHLRQQVEDVRNLEIHAVEKAVARGVFLRHLDG